MGIDQRLEQRVKIKFLVKLGQEWIRNSSNGATGLWRGYPKGKNCFQVGTAFWEGHEDPKDDARSGRPSTSSGNENIDCVRSLVLSDR